MPTHDGCPDPHVFPVIDAKSKAGQTAIMSAFLFHSASSSGAVRRQSLRRQCQRHPRSQRGAGMAEFTLVAIPVLLLGLGGIEVSHWLFTRQAISLALLEAGRAAITHHNHPDRIIYAFESALLPLYVTAAPGGARQRLQQSMTRRQQLMQAAPWQIEVLSPSAAAYIDFGDKTLRVSGSGQRPAINNNYLSEQHQRHRARGWVDGRGPVSGQTIYQANTVVLRLNWPHEPRLPLIAPILRALGKRSGNYRERAFAQAYLPMLRQMTLLMQSHPVQWSDDPGGKVLFRAENGETGNRCRGWLCHARVTPEDIRSKPDQSLHPAPPGQAARPGTSDTLPDGDNQPSLGAGSDHPADHSDAPTPHLGEASPENPDYGDIAVDPDDPACGVTLCCV